MNPHKLDDHDLGLQADLALMAQRIQSRRKMLGLMLTGGAAAVIAGCGGGGDATDTTTTTTPTTGSGGSNSSCIAAPSETAGPYPSDGSNTVNGMVSNVLSTLGVVRSDIRSSFGSSVSVAAGVPLTLNIKLVNSNNSCATLAGAAIYLWHCTRDGAYSLYSSGLLNENYLRGVQVSDANGDLSFTTIFPGCYSGRYPHIHFEIYPSSSLATLYTNRILTSQMALPRDVCSTVYANATGYSASATNLNGVTIASDNVFGDNTAAQQTAMTPTLSGSVSAGYTAAITIGVPVS